MKDMVHMISHNLMKYWELNGVVLFIFYSNVNIFITRHYVLTKIDLKVSTYYYA